MTKTLFRQILNEKIKIITNELNEKHFSQKHFNDTAHLIKQITTSDKLIDFLTLPNYRLLT